MDERKAVKAVIAEAAGHLPMRLVFETIDARTVEWIGLATTGTYGQTAQRPPADVLEEVLMYLRRGKQARMAATMLQSYGLRIVPD